MVEKNRAMLEMNDVYANYGLVQALQGVSLRVKQEEIVALIGPHGGGKSAILKAICGLLPIAKGEILFGKQCIHRLPPEKVVALGIAYVDERMLLFSSMRVIDNLILGAYHRHGEDKGRIEQDIQNVFQLFPILKERRKQSAGTLSGGEQQMLAIGRALMSSPKLLLLDCPSLRLAPMLVMKVMKVISELRDWGVTILLIEQNAPAALNIADRGYVMEEGRIVLEGYPKELLSVYESRRLISRKKR